MMERCPECGTPLDEVPFAPCHYHAHWQTIQTELSPEELEELLEAEAAEAALGQL